MATNETNKIEPVLDTHSVAARQQVGVTQKAAMRTQRAAEIEAACQAMRQAALQEVAERIKRKQQAMRLAALQDVVAQRIREQQEMQ
jgi:hypothetical protein